MSMRGRGGAGRGRGGHGGRGGRGGAHNRSEGDEERRPAAFRGDDEGKMGEPRMPRVDAATIKYLTTLGDTLADAEKLAEMDPDQIEALVGNGLREIADKPGVYREGTSSRVLQRLLKHATEEQLRQMGKQMAPEFWTLAVHVNGSHVAQAFLRACPPIIEREVSAGATALEGSLTGVLLSICTTLPDFVRDICFDPTGGPVVRTLVNVFAGLNVDTMAPKQRELDLPSRMLAELDKPAAPLTPVPILFADHLTSVARALMEGTEDEELDGMCGDHKASSLIQLLLLVGKHNGKVLDITLGRLLGPINDGRLQEDAAEVLRTMALHEVGSRLVEKIVEVAPATTWFALFTSVFRGKLAPLVADRFANHVITTLIASAKRAQHLELILDELRSQFDTLMTNQRGLVVFATLMAAVKVQSQHKSLLQLVCKALHAQGNHERKVLAKLLVFMTPFERLSGNTSPPSRIGCLIAQALLRFPDAECRVVAESVALLTSSELISWSKDASASRVIESTLSSACPLATKQRLVRAMTGTFADMATDKFGSHTLDAAWANADVSMRSTIAEELLAREVSLRASNYGRIALRNCRVDAFKAKRTDWEDRERSISRKKEMFADIIGEDEEISGAGKGKEANRQAEIVARLRAEKDENMTALGFGGTGAAKAAAKTKKKSRDDDDAAARALALEEGEETNASSNKEIEDLFKKSKKKARMAAAAAKQEEDEEEEEEEEQEEEEEEKKAVAPQDDVMRDVLDAIAHSKRRRNKTKSAEDESEPTPKKKRFLMS